MSRTNKNIKKTILVVLIALLVILAGSYTYVAAKNGYWPFPTQATNSSADTSDTNDSSSETPVGDEPAYNGEKNPENTPDDMTEVPTEAGSANAVGVGIASAGLYNNQVEVRAFVTDVIEGGGTCTATFTKNNRTVTESSEAFIDASTSQCRPIIIDRSRFSEAGTWSVVVTYTSSTSKGESAPIEVSL
jgi:hypothetical protein